ncbi:hypothetical protein NEOLEDRAFT_936005 [Neolentinus lepideus HHB14362 ss-1]|uniref:Conidiation protein 6 n=1 Tax=Neolentinus lepideus HHB14362 ss-1 TaxID=1314782 RepID=A0A165NIU9_9AGAM|nr:hypothetical protein NEOLEDRAFT_936005 [Neolentinus lepideus HHB14362 ss-1]
MSDPTRVAAGLKAAIHNPNVSGVAKERAAERLENMDTSTGTGGVETSRQLGGYKATLSNPHTSEQAKNHAREILEAAGYTAERGEGITEEEHNTRVLAGYKAALHNPRVSEEAKYHAREYLEANNVL